MNKIAMNNIQRAVNGNRGVCLIYAYTRRMGNLTGRYGRVCRMPGHGRLNTIITR